MKFYFKSTTLDKEIGWTWAGLSMNDKAYWDTWIPKKSDIKIRSKLPKGKLQAVKNELWEDLSEDLQILKDRLNERRRKKRLDNAS